MYGLIPQLVLSPSQLKTLKDFCNDVAKGLFLAVAVQSNLTPAEFVLVTTTKICVALFFLYLALLFSQEVDYD